MTYTVRRFENTYSTTDKTDISVLDKSILSTATSISYVGKSVTGYSQTFAENFLWLLENFASDMPPAFALKGQLWFNTTGNTFYIYEGDDPNKGGDSTVLSNWNPIVLNTASGITAHEALTGFSDPHQVTKAQLNLSNVSNVFVLDRSLNLSDLTNTSIARSNLDVYEKSLVYTKTEYDANFYKIGDTVSNASLFNSTSSSTLVNSSSPIVNIGIDATSITNNDILIADDNRMRLSLGNGAAFNVISGGNNSNVVQTTNNSIIRMSFLTSQVSPQWKITQRGLSTPGSSPTVVQELIFNNSGLFVNNNKVYHTGNIPTNSDLGTLAATGQAINSLLLNGKTNDTNATPNTIVEVGTNGVIYISEIFSYDTTVSSLQSNSEIIFRNNVSDNTYRAMTKTSFQSWIQPVVPPLTRAWISFNGVTGSTFGTGNNCIVTKISTGTYTVTLTDPLASTLYNISVGSMCDLPSGSTYTSGDNKMRILRSWTTINSPVSGLQNFTVYVKEIVNDYFSDTQADSFISRLADTDFINVCVIY